jgi:DNA-binding Lrp family transcriptional regulator
MAELAVHESLHGSELARRLGVAQPPVWRALRQLEGEGAVVSTKVGTVRFYSAAAGDVRSARRAVQAIALRRQARGSGSDLDHLMSRRKTMDWWLHAEEALAGIPHAVIGGVAAAAYMPGRQTDDIDFAVGVRDAERAEAALRNAGWQKLRGLDIVEGSAWRDDNGNELDLILTQGPWVGDALAEAASNIVAGLPTMPLPYLTLLKLSAGRLTDMSDLARMLGLADEQARSRVRDAVGRHGTPGDLEDLEQVILLGRLELGQQVSDRPPSKTIDF